MKRIALFTSAVLAALATVLVIATTASAVSWDYCAYSLRGGGSLAPDHDIQIKVDQFRANGRSVSATSHGWWNYPSGSYLVVEAVKFHMGDGSVEVRHFECYGSGSSYHDRWAGY